MNVKDRLLNIGRIAEVLDEGQMCLRATPPDGDDVQLFPYEDISEFTDQMQNARDYLTEWGCSEIRYDT